MNKRTVSEMGEVLGNESGQGLTEYMLLLLLISVVSIGIVKSVGSTVEGKLTMARDHIKKEAILKD